MRLTLIMSLIYVYPPVLIPVPLFVYDQVSEAVGRVERVYACICICVLLFMHLTLYHC